MVTFEEYGRIYARQITLYNGYTDERMDWNVRFQPMYQERRSTTELNLDRINDITPVGEQLKS